MLWKTALVFLCFVAVSLLFFGLSIDNGFWNSRDYIKLENSLMMMDDPSAAFACDGPFIFQPLVNVVHYLLFKSLLFDSRGYMLFNILLHALNSLLVYLLVMTLLRDRVVSFLSGLLFAFTVGSYGKSVMISSGSEDLIPTTLILLAMIFYFRAALRGKGRMLSADYMLALLFFVATLLTGSNSFTILGSLAAFNYFFRKEIGRPVFRRDLLLLLLIAVFSLIFKAAVFGYFPPLYSSHPGPAKFIFYSGKNLINYIVRMIFPIHTSSLVAEAGGAVRFVYGFATAIRILLALTVLSYSFFGFIFGNRTIRFFIAWTYIMILPFAFIQFPYDWLNMRHLYLVSIGFVSVIAAGAVYCSRLIASQRWKRLVPYIVPLFFILMSRFIVTQLDRSYERNVSSRLTSERARLLAEKFPAVELRENRLEMKK